MFLPLNPCWEHICTWQEFCHARLLGWGHSNPKHPYKVWGIWTLMEHMLPEISAASTVDRQPPSSGSFVPMSTVGGHQFSLITPALLVLLLAEQFLKTCPYPRPKKSHACSVAFLLRRLGCFYGVTTTHSFRQRMGCLTTLNSRSWQGGEGEEAGS